ncbi:hypothetical protein JCM11491_001377 [Sporobolomyces phaffii]
MTSEPDYNTDHPPTLYEAGICSGKAVEIDTASIRALGTRHGIFVAAWKGLGAESRACSVVVKTVVEDGSRAPRNGRREARLLARLEHPNIVPLLNAYLYPPSSTSLSETIHIFMPFFPFTLRQLLDTPAFLSDNSLETFASLSISIASQLISATSYLHNNAISHRDINPSNIVVSAAGRPLLIDFGIAVDTDDEKEGEQHFEVGTGPYRAPELVFAARSYDIFAIDVWALAATICELFRPFEPAPASSSPSSPDPFSERTSFGFAPSEPLTSSPKRESLFNSGQSDFVLAASIFRIVGTPTLETWPEAERLPNFSRFSFASFPPTPLESHLPYLATASPLLDVLRSMMTCSASKRMTAATAEDRLRSLSTGGITYRDFLTRGMAGHCEAP